MAFFNDDDLIEEIRHEFGIEDETGLCMRILPKPERKSKPGGLPLNFRSDNSYESDDEQYSPGYMVSFDGVPTKKVIQSRLRSKTSESDKSGGADGTCENILVAGKDTVPDRKKGTELFRFRCPRRVALDHSETSRLLAEEIEVMDPALASYAKFEATDPSNRRELLVFFPFADSLPEEPYGCALKVFANPQTTVSDLVGLCCYVYTRNDRTPAIKDPSRFQLLMAEENGEVECDLPAVDGQRILADLGSCWSTVALVPRSSFGNSDYETNKVTVYTVTGGKYEFELDSADVTLRWLRDRALEKRIEEEGNGFISEYPVLQEYILEAISERDVPLNLDVTIGSVAVDEFILLRKNSSRGDFKIPGRVEVEPESKSQFLAPRSVSPSSTRSSPRLDFLRRLSSVPTEQPILLTPTSPTKSECPDLGEPYTEYNVERIHRYKPKFSAKLLLCKEGFEVSPAATERKRGIMFAQSVEKSIVILWDHVGGIDIGDRPNAKRLLRITWIPLPASVHQEFRSNSPGVSVGSSPGLLDSQELVRSELSSYRHFAQIYEGTNWKVLQLETSVDDAWNIAEKVNDIIDTRRSSIRSLYQNSSGGSKRPSAAWEVLSSASIKEKSEGTYKKSSSFIGVRKISKIASSMAHPVPAIQRVFSRVHDSDTTKH